MAKDKRLDTSQAPLKSRHYQDYVIRDGELVGDFEGLYRDFEDPWHQSRYDHVQDRRRSLAINWCNRLRSEYGVNRVVELGCGFGHLTQALHQQNFCAVGTDVAKTAIEKARTINPGPVFIECALSDFATLEKFDADIYLMAEITWYVLDDLDLFIENMKKHRARRGRPLFLIHLLTTYAPGIQKYGVETFSNLDEILAYFGLNYLESGFMRTPREDDASSQGTYFVAKL